MIGLPPQTRVKGVGRQQHLMVDGETHACVVFVICETLLMERILLLQLESEMDG